MNWNPGLSGCPVSSLWLGKSAFIWFFPSVWGQNKYQVLTAGLLSDWALQLEQENTVLNLPVSVRACAQSSRIAFTIQSCHWAPLFAFTRWRDWASEDTPCAQSQAAVGAAPALCLVKSCRFYAQQQTRSRCPVTFGRWINTHTHMFPWWFQNPQLPHSLKPTVFGGY